MDATTAGQAALELAVQNRQRVQSQRQFGGPGKQELRHQFQLLQIKVRHENAVEQHQSIGSRGLELLGKVRKGADEGGKLYRYGDLHAGLHGAHHVGDALLQGLGGLQGVRGDLVDIQLQGVRASLFHKPRAVQPPGGCRAIQRGDDGHRHSLFDAANLLQVGVGTQCEFMGLGKIGEPFWVGVRMEFQIPHGAEILPFDLFFEKRVHHNGGGACVLQFPDSVHVIHQRRSTHHQGMRQRQAKVGCG